MLLTDDEIEQIVMDDNGRDCFEFARAIETAILAKLASAELPEPAMKHYQRDFRMQITGETPFYTADQLRKAFAQGAASQLSAEPVVFLAPSGHVYGMKVAAGTNSKPLFTRKEPK